MEAGKAVISRLEQKVKDLGDVAKEGAKKHKMLKEQMQHEAVR